MKKNVLLAALHSFRWKVPVCLIIGSVVPFLLLSCDDEGSPAANALKTSLATRQWKGESFATLNIGGSSRVVKDVVLSFDFRNDGGCSLSQASMSVSSVAGEWRLENEGKNLILTLHRSFGTVTEYLTVKELTATRFVIGDTTVYGYSLIPQ
ncbi:MAG: hypothetical protein WCW40_02380 [Bacteroidota bacterium]